MGLWKQPYLLKAYIHYLKNKNKVTRYHCTKHQTRYGDTKMNKDVLCPFITVQWRRYLWIQKNGKNTIETVHTNYRSNLEKEKKKRLYEGDIWTSSSERVIDQTNKLFTLIIQTNIYFSIFKTRINNGHCSQSIIEGA